MRNLMPTDEHDLRTIPARIVWARPGRRLTRSGFLTAGRLKRLVRAFDEGRLSAGQWTHRTRLAVGLWHSLSASPEEAREAMRRGITGCTAALGGAVAGGGYHETLTVFFLRMIEAFAVAAPPELDLVGLANALLDSVLANPRLAGAFYSPERLCSARARAAWVRPDLQPIQWPPVVAKKSALISVLRARAA